MIMMMMVMVMMMMMNCFCGMVDRRKGSSLISSRDHYQRFSPSRISNTPRAGFESAQNLSLGFVEWSSAVVITTTSFRQSIDWTIFECLVVYDVAIVKMRSGKRIQIVSKVVSGRIPWTVWSEPIIYLIWLKLTLSMCKRLNSNRKQYCTYCAIVGVQRKTKSVFDFHGTRQSVQRFSFYCCFPLTSRNM